MNHETRNTLEFTPDVSSLAFLSGASRFTKLPLYICRESSTNQLLFMQNKPNFRKSQMNVSNIITRNYEIIIPLAGQKNKPNSNPIKPICHRAQMNINLTLTKDYRKKDDFAVRKNKPNSNPISKKLKMNANAFSQKDYENISRWRLKKNKPKQSQWIGNEFKSPISPKLTNRPIYQRPYLYYTAADLINAVTVTLTRIWNLSIFHSIISHRNTSLTSDSLMPEITKTDE